MLMWLFLIWKSILGLYDNGMSLVLFNKVIMYLFFLIDNCKLIVYISFNFIWWSVIFINRNKIFV